MNNFSVKAYILALLLLTGCDAKTPADTYDVTCYDTRTDTVTGRWVYMDHASCNFEGCDFRVDETKTIYRIAPGEACLIFKSE